MGIIENNSNGESCGRVLVVDDNATLCETLRSIFEKKGHYAVGAISGKEAIDAAKKERFDVALLDVRLPDIDGTDLLTELSKIDSDMEYIFITGYASVDNVVRAMEKKASGYLTKPLDIERTLETVSRIIEKKQLIQAKLDAEKALLDSEQLFRSIFRDSPIGINVFDADGNLVAANQAILDFAGVASFEEMSTLNIFDDPNTSDLIKEQMRRGETVFYKKEFDYDIIKKSDLYPTTKEGIVFISGGITPLRNEPTGEIQGYIVQIVDETIQKKAERVIRESEELFRGVFEQSPFAVELFDINGRLLRANPATQELFGIESMEDYMGFNLYEDPNTPEWVKAGLRNGIPVRFVLVFDFEKTRQSNLYESSKSGVIHLDVLHTPLDIDGDGALDGILSHIRDITEQKIAEKALEKQTHRLNERVKELTCLSETTHLLANEQSIDKIFKDILPLIQVAWQYPEITGVQVVYKSKEYKTSNYKETQWKLSENIRVFGEVLGELCIVYLEERPPKDVGLFVKEEKQLLAALSEKLGNYLERKFERDALSDSEERYRYLFENLADGVAIVDLNGSITMCNEKLLNIFGYTLDETIGNSFTYFLAPESRETALAQFQEGIKIKSLNPDGLELTATRKEGSTIVIHISNTILYENGQPIGFQSLIRDITNEKEAERSILEERDRAQGYLDIAGAVIVVLDKEGYVSLINQKGSEILGYSIDDIVGKEWFEHYIPESMRIDVRQVFLGLMRGENGDFNAYENPVLTSSGEERIIEWRNSMITDPEGKLIGVMSSGVDVTERRKAEAELITAKEFADTAINSQMDTFFVFDPNTGKAIQWNNAFRIISGYTNEEIETLPAPSSYYNESDIDKATEFIQHILNGDTGTVEMNLETKSGERIPFEYSASVINDEATKSNFIVSIGRDISDRKKAVQDLRTAAETATLYLDIMGHDVRNHLQAIVMGTDIMSHLELGAEVEPIFDLIVESVENSQKLIDQVQATRALLSTSLKCISLSDQFDSCMKKIADSYDDVEFEIVSEVNTGEIFADEFLEVICRNLVDNAVQHNTNKDRKVWITLREMKDSYVITVQDDGPGITDERKESLFDAERRFGGIGIHQAKKIVEKYGGSISVGDRISGDHTQGASFDVWLPQAKDAPKGESVL